MKAQTHCQRYWDAQCLLVCTFSISPFITYDFVMLGVSQVVKVPVLVELLKTKQAEIWRKASDGGAESRRG